MTFLFRKNALCVGFFAGFLAATETVMPISPPQNSVRVGGIVELRNDVYSVDAHLLTELSPLKKFSVFSDISYRFLSYEWEALWLDQLHQPVNLCVNGLNETYLGFKFFATENFGFSSHFRFAPGSGSQVDRFERIAFSPLSVYPFSAHLLLGASIDFFTFLAKDSFDPGDEIGGRISMIWKPFFRLKVPRGLQLTSVFLWRHRVQESRNLHMKKSYQKMDDKYFGFRLREEILYKFTSLPLGYGFVYEMNQGTLFGDETGHRVEFFLKFVPHY